MDGISMAINTDVVIDAVCMSLEILHSF